MAKLLDNVTTPANNKMLYQALIDHPWHFLKNTAYASIDNNQPYQSSWQWMLFNQGESNSHLVSVAESILVKALYELDIPYNKLIRIRAGLTTRTPSPVIHDPHVDWENDHMTALYYVNDSDGDTLLYDRFRQPSDEPSWKILESETFNIVDRITPKADRMVIFNGLQYHSSTSPVETDHRIILNFNFV